MGLDEDTPRLLGLRLSSTRLVFLAVSVLLTGTSIASVGAIGFVGLVSPHAARALVGRRHTRVIPVAVLFVRALRTPRGAAPAPAARQPASTSS